MITTVSWGASSAMARRIVICCNMAIQPSGLFVHPTTHNQFIEFFEVH